MIGARRLSERQLAFTQVMAPRGPFPHAGSTSPGRATARYTQTTPLRAEVVPGAAWSRRRTRDRRPQRSKQGSCKLAQDSARGARPLPPGARWTIAYPRSSDDIPSSESHRMVDQVHTASRALSGTPWDGASRWDVRIIVPSGQGANIEWR